MNRSALCLAAIGAISISSAWAESEPKTIEACARTASQLAYKQCIGEILEMMEWKLVSKLADARKDFHGDEANTAFDEAQNAWASYQTRECWAAFERVAPGSDASAAETRCRIKLINDRIENLENGY